MGSVCVTGAAGFIGSHLVARLKAEGHHVRAVDVRYVESRRELYEQADEVSIGVDLRGPLACETALHGADVVAHLAADHGGAGYFHSERDQPAARNNMQIDLNVLRACEQTGSRLFYASSFCAYPVDVQDRPTPLAETELYRGTPEACYGMEKRTMTRFCEDATFDARCGVFATIYGPGQEHEGIRAKFPTAITHRALEAKRTGRLEVWGDGSQIRTFLYIDDAIDRIYRVLSDDTYGGPVNIASDEQVTVAECVDRVCGLIGITPEIHWNLDKPTGVAARVPDNSEFHRRYGEGKQTPMREGFRQLYEWLAKEAERVPA